MGVTHKSGILHKPCETCKTTKMTVVKVVCTEEWYQYTDANGNRHNHDENEGVVVVRCENGHETTQKFLWECACGWTSELGWTRVSSDNKPSGDDDEW